MVDSCILEHRSNYSFDIVTSMGIPASSIYMSHIICISPIDGNHINTKTKSHHAPSPEAPPLYSESYDVHQPYIELFPSYIRGKYVNPKNPRHSSLCPTPPKDTISQHSFHSIRPSKTFHDLPFDPHTLVKAQKHEKGFKNP